MNARIRRPNRLLAATGIVVVLGCVFYTWHQLTGRSDGELVSDAQTAMTDGDFQTAYEIAALLLEKSPDSQEALSVAGRAALHLGRCSEAEELLMRAIEVDPANREARLSLVWLRRVEGRFREVQPHALALLRMGDTDISYLLPLAAPDALRLSAAEFELAASCRALVPEDSLPTLGFARHHMQVGEFVRATALLKTIVNGEPPQVEAQALLGSALLEIDNETEFQRWHQQLPPSAEEHPEIWFLRGIWARSHQQPRAAIRCFLESITRDPSHRRAHYQITQTMTALGMSEAAKVLTDRFKLLEEVSRLATKGNDGSGGQWNATIMLEIASRMEHLGRFWEATGWYRAAIEFVGESHQAQQRLSHIAGQITQDTPLTHPAFHPAGQMDLLEYPLPDWVADGARESAAAQQMSPQTTVAFANEAASVGLNFTYYNDAKPELGRARMFDFSGGGIAILDYDGDLWPDVYLTQGCEWPPKSSRRQDRDKLFRNVNGERFEDVTEGCGLGDEQYSQGVTVGDLDNDGFPDLYLANIGSNRLYRNNGDGTFTDVTAVTGTGGTEWTMSCVLADINGDSLPDIYEVNYLTGSDIYERQCTRDGLPVQCSLNYFRSAQDRLYLNLGDAGFKDVTEEAGVALPEGKGMGIVAASFGPSERPSLFIANDDKPNFFLVDNQPQSSGTPRFADFGAASGLAFDDKGATQSSMGVAAGDVNNDGLLDMYVTNFTKEHNNLYVQQAANVFEDKARDARLPTPTVRQMGWGAQFLDGDLDGLLDIVVANGHLDENTSKPEPYRMRTQYFRNLGDNRFEESVPNGEDSYFGQPHVGRAVARIDWNRDGLNDICITHVDSPVALLTNRTVDAGHSLTLHLRGVTCNRDAIGSVIRVTSGNRQFYRHLIAGDGFQASNERKTVFGVDGVDTVTVFWPSGVEQVISNPAVDIEYIVIEGQQPHEVSGSR